MAHPAQRQFFERVKAKFPQSFTGVKVIDCGSLDVNGSLKSMFHDSSYLGVDIVRGQNVDLVRLVKDLSFNESFDTVVSGEMLEHSEFYQEDFRKMYQMLKHGGLLAISAAGKGRPEHGTRRTGDLWGTNPDYYKNIEKEDVERVFDLPNEFTEYEILEENNDFYFWGIKK